MAHTAEEWSQIGRDKNNSGHYWEAIEALNKAIIIDPNNSTALYRRGYSKWRLENYQSALLDLEKSIQISPNRGDVYIIRAIVKNNLGNYYGAMEDYTKSIELGQKDLKVYYNRGNTKLELGDYRGAIEDFDTVIEIDQNHEGAYAFRSMAKLFFGDYSGARYDFDYVIQIGNVDASLFWISAMINNESGSIHAALIDFNYYLQLTNRVSFFRYAYFVLQFYHAHPAPYLLYHTLEKFSDNFDQFNTLHPIVDTTRQQCQPWKRWEEWRKLSGTENHDPLAHNHALALVNHYMGDCIEAFRIYDEILDDEKVMGVPLNLMGLYYYIESAKLFRQPHEVILEDAIEQIEGSRDELIQHNALRELYYAGQILWANDHVMEAQEFFELADAYLPAAYMQVLTLPMMGVDEEAMEAKITDIREREAELPPSDGFLPGFPARPFRLEKPGEDFLAPVLHYAHYREITQAIAEVRDPNQPFEHHEMWDAFYWKPEDEKELDWLLRRERLAEINKVLLEKFKANVQSGTGVHTLEHLETAFAQKLKHDLWEGTQYLDFEDLKSKSEAWPDAAREVATLIRDSQRLDANSKLLIVEYCYLRGSLSIEDVYLLYFYISYVTTAQDSIIASEANSAAVKKVVELTLTPVSLTGKVLTAAAGGAVAGLFKLFLSDTNKQDQINMKEFQNPKSVSTLRDNFEVFCEHFLRFISYQRETLGQEAFEKQYPLEGFEDRSRK